MFQEFYSHCRRSEYWKQDQRILLAISGGIDSMVLLNLMQTAAQKDQLKVAVAHIDHQLRKESVQEAAYLKDYCQEQGIPYYSKKWTALDKEKNTEARARKFRYDFFAEIMEKKNYTTLFTAHHNDDQAETVLMKLTRGSALSNLVGIRSRQPFGGGELIRPFLIFSKEQLEQFARKSEIVYFEDSSNQSDAYMRNRIRHQVVPVLKKENQQFLQHITNFSEQIELANELILSVINPKYDRWVEEIAEGWKIQLSELEKEKESIQTFFLVTLFQRTLVQKGVTVSQVHIQQFLSLLNQAAPQKSLDIEQGWQVIKEYDVAYLKKEQFDQGELLFYLKENEQVFLSEKEWIGLETAEKKIELPETIKNWEEYSLIISDQVSLPLTIRHRKNGDRISLTPDLTKRLNRLFIDQKIPNHIREQAWIILSGEGNIIWVPKFANSYLSIPKETDKIHYRLLYKINE
ncbi:tRNA lysidine(34) synthetase TilS [Enterococcus quebecensis]|uniref:tRNA(Ile)-lysidine synthase n=1 Tax=Enterococcus quebecensis TaxID=903983 RepID=A0A1E5GRK3_9ENTE|nr:tRNA lysidine(34) synthetase TilS [Enterococcus quebecensis]OEG15343.1 tRNA lysidine(34) synthetase TilS [Enterococcus quebecensis]